MNRREGLIASNHIQIRHQGQDLFSSSSSLHLTHLLQELLDPRHVVLHHSLGKLAHVAAGHDLGAVLGLCLCAVHALLGNKLAKEKRKVGGWV